MTIQATPFLTIDGEEYTHDSAPGARRAIADLSISWGTEHLDTPPDAAILTAALWSPEPTDLWRDSLIGRYVTAGFEIPETGTRSTEFRGVITEQSVKRRSQWRGKSDTYGGLITTFTASDLRAQLANIMPTQASLPRESPKKRLARVLGQFNDRHSQIADVVGPETDVDYWGMPPVDASNRNLADLLDAVYLTEGKHWVYWPDARTVSWLAIDPYDAPDKLVLTTHDGELHIAMKVRYIGGDSLDTVTPGRYCQIDDTATRKASDQITDVSVTCYSDTNPEDTRPPVAFKSLHSSNAVQASKSITVEIVSPNFANGVGQELIYLYDSLRKDWNYPAITYDSRLSGGFAHADEAYLLLGAQMTNAVHYITGSWFNRLNPTPVFFRYINGVVAWIDDHWEVTIQPVPAVNSVGYQTPICWTELPQKPKWNQRGSRFNPAVTWEDLRLVSEGT